MDARDTEPGLSSRGVTFAAHTFAAWTRADPEVVWTALTDPGQTPEFLYGLAADSTWLIRPGPGGCTIRLQIDEIDTADSLQDAEDIWLPVLEALQQLVNPGQV